MANGLTREELAQQTLDSARQAVDTLNADIDGYASASKLREDAKQIGRTIEGLREFLPLSDDPFPIPPVEVNE